MPGKEGASSSITSSLPLPPRRDPRSDGQRRPRRVDSGASGRKRRHDSHAEPYTYEKAHGGSRRTELTLVLCVYNASDCTWRTTPVTFDRYRATDEELWTDIRNAYRRDLWPLWRRIFLFTREKFITPIEFSPNGVPKRQDPKTVPNEHSFLHSYHHPYKLRTTHDWIDWFSNFASDPSKTYGLEFTQRLWAEKLAFLAILLTIAIIVVSIVWMIKGGNLQSVFTVMSFVLSGIAAYIALIALYYQATIPG